MDKKTQQIIFAVLALLMLIGLWPKISRIFQTEEAKLKRIIYAAKRATEKEDLVTCASFISFEYQDVYGNDRLSLLFAAKRAFADYDNIKLTIKELDIQINGQDVTAQIEAVGTGRNLGTSQVEYDIVKFKVFFREDNDAWKVIRLEFEAPQNIPFLQNIT